MLNTKLTGNAYLIFKKNRVRQNDAILGKRNLQFKNDIISFTGLKKAVVCSFNVPYIVRHSNFVQEHSFMM